MSPRPNGSFGSENMHSNVGKDVMDAYDRLYNNSFNPGTKKYGQPATEAAPAEPVPANVPVESAQTIQIKPCPVCNKKMFRIDDEKQAICCLNETCTLFKVDVPLAQWEKRV